jgi:hypothetical protein
MIAVEAFIIGGSAAGFAAASTARRHYLGAKLALIRHGERALIRCSIPTSLTHGALQRRPCCPTRYWPKTMSERLDLKVGFTRSRTIAKLRERRSMQVA